MFPTALYEFQMAVRMAEVVKGARELKTHFVNSIFRFAILGGAKRSIRRNGENNIGDADLMSEFYQAKQFNTLIVSKDLDFDSFLFQKIYDKHLSFEFSFMVRTLNPESRFKILQLDAKNARVIKPPATEGDGETLNIKYSSPQVIYWHSDALGVRAEKL